MNTTAEDLNYLANTNEYGSYVPETCKAAIAEIARLTEERDRYEDALVEITLYSPRDESASEVYGNVLRIARQALYAKPQENPQ
jgi:hypothetical protein